LKFLLGVINSRLMSFWFEKKFDKLQRKIFPQFKVDELGSFPIHALDLENKTDKVTHNRIESLVDARLSTQARRQALPLALSREIRHSNRMACNLAHYLQKDFAAAVKGEILIDDVQRTGFVNEIQVESVAAVYDRRHSSKDCSGGHRPPLQEITLIASVAESSDSEARPVPVLRLAFQDDALRQFIHACWRRFLGEHARQKKWTKGRKAEGIYALVVNRLEPLAYFNPTASDNLRAIRDLMEAVAREAGTADLAAVESEIKRLDFGIDALVYELYGLTEEEIRIVEGVTGCSSEWKGS